MGADPSPRVTDPQPRLVQTSVGGIALTDEGPHGASAILCVHGVPGSSRDWRYLAPLLAPTLRVVRLEMPGFGASPPGADDTIDGWARVTTAVADSLGLERFVLMGHSYGGGVATLATARSPDRVSGLVLIAPIGARLHRGFGVPPAQLRMFGDAIANPETRDNVFAMFRAGLEQKGLSPPDDWRDAARQLSLIGSVDFDAIGDAARKARVRCIVAHADDDRLLEPEIVTELAELLGDARVLRFESGGHHQQKHHAAEIAEAVLSDWGDASTSPG